MTMSVMNFSRIRDLMSNLGWQENDNTYTVGPECLEALESIEEELLNEDVINRNVHMSLYVCETVKKDLIPILLHGKNNKIHAVATRVLVNLSLPVECLLPAEDALHSSKTQKIRKQLLSASFEIKKAFLIDAATVAIVAALRETIINSEKHHVLLSEDDCVHLKNCLLLLQNILHLPEEYDFGDASHNFLNWQEVQNKLIWNLFVQGLDGALLLMLNSKYRAHWTVPMTLIIALLYRNQSITKVHEALELISSASDTSCDEEESDGSKNSSASLSSEPSKANKESSDSGCVLVSDNSIASLCGKEMKGQTTQKNCFNFDIYTKLEKVQISDSEPQTNLIGTYGKMNHSPKSFVYREADSGSSSYSESPEHKKMKVSTSLDEQVSMSEGSDYSSKEDLVLIESKDCSFPDILSNSLNDLDKKSTFEKNFKAVQKLRSLQMHAMVSESDSSIDDLQNFKLKYRNPPPAGRRGKSPRRNNGCTPSVCMNSAIAASVTKTSVKYPLWTKRNSVTTLVDNNSAPPSDEDIGNLIKEFTMSFLHSGFCHLVQDLKDLLLSGSPVTVDKSLLFWILSYFLHLSATVNLNIDHISTILNPDVIGYLVYECVLACENVKLHSEANMKIKRYLFDQLSLVVTALKEILIAIVTYAKKSRKDKCFFPDLYGKLAHSEDLRNIPLLLFQNCHQVDAKSFIENTVILNHYILTVIEKGMEYHPESKKFSFVHHLKHFSTKNVVNSYGLLLENYKYNSDILNECLFTMMHHIAGDVHSSELLIEPSILKSFSSILEEDIELLPYQEDLIMYILNKFSLQIKKSLFKKRKHEEECCSSSDASSSSSSSVISNLLSEEDDDLFWWYLQFEQDKDPIARISEHIPISKRDILTKLQLKGIISPEMYKTLEAKMENVDEEKNSVLLSCEDVIEMESFDEEINHLLRTLVQSGWRQHLTWIQDSLIEICYVKLGLDKHLSEPIPFYSIKKRTSVLLVPYTEEQRLILQDPMFLQLLKKIGFHLGTDMWPMYPRIPLFWTAHVLFTIAARLGPMRKDKLKFSYNDLLLAEPNYNSDMPGIHSYPELPPLSSCCTLSSWLTAVQNSKEDKELQ